MRYLALIPLLLVVACSTTDPAQANRNRLAAIESTYGVSASAAIGYLSRPMCPKASGITASNNCRDPGISSTIITIDKATARYIDNAHKALKENPTASTTVALIDAAKGSVDAYDKVVGETGAK